MYHSITTYIKCSPVRPIRESFKLKTKYVFFYHIMYLNEKKIQSRNSCKHKRKNVEKTMSENFPLHNIAENKN